MFSPVHPHKYSYCKAVCGYSCLFTTVSIFLSLIPHCSLHPQPPPHPHPHLCCNGYHSLTLAQRVIAYLASCLCWPAKMHNSTHWSRDMRDDTQVLPVITCLQCSQKFGLTSTDILFPSPISAVNSHIWHSCAGRALLHWRKECGRLWVQLASAMQARPHAQRSLHVHWFLLVLITSDIKRYNNLYLSFYRRW